MAAATKLRLTPVISTVACVLGRAVVADNRQEAQHFQNMQGWSGKCCPPLILIK